MDESEPLVKPRAMSRDAPARRRSFLSTIGSGAGGIGGSSVGLMSGARRYLVGLTFLFGVVLLWSISDFISAALQTGENAWVKPFLITYLNTSSFGLYLIPSAIKYRSRRKGLASEAAYEPISQSDAPTSPLLSPVSPSRSPRSLALALPDDRHRHPRPHPRRSFGAARTVEEEEMFYRGDSLEADRSSSIPASTPAPKLTVAETARVAAWWAAAWFVANYAVTAALAWTSVASVSILSATSGFFTLALGKLVGVEELTRTKVFAVLASFLGVILVTKSDSTISPAATIEPNLPTRPLLGDFLALLSAAFYAVYVIMMKKALGDEDRADMRLMLGFAGLFSTVFLLPAFPILHYMGWEPFELPPSRGAWLICGLNMLITLSSDYMYMLAMLKTTPMLVTIGISLTIPLALIGSMFIPTATPAAITPLSLGGAALVVAAFGLLGWQEWQASLRSGSAIGQGAEEGEDGRV